MVQGSQLPPGTVDVEVDGEWSFAQTLRHLVFATDTWWRNTALRIPDDEAFHPIAVPYDDCLETIVSEEWHHHRYALRDLAAIEE